MMLEEFLFRVHPFSLRPCIQELKDQDRKLHDHVVMLPERVTTSEAWVSTKMVRRETSRH